MQPLQSIDCCNLVSIVTQLAGFHGSDKRAERGYRQRCCPSRQSSPRHKHHRQPCVLPSHHVSRRTPSQCPEFFYVCGCFLTLLGTVWEPPFRRRERPSDVGSVRCHRSTAGDQLDLTLHEPNPWHHCSL